MKRPIPTQDLLESVVITLRPAPEGWSWITDQIIADTGRIHNEDHAHLLDAHIRVVWALSSAAEIVRMAKRCDISTGDPSRTLAYSRATGAC